MNENSTETLFTEATNLPVPRNGSIKTLSSSEIELITDYRVRLKTHHPDPAARPVLFCRRYGTTGLTGGGVNEKITLRIAAADGEDELLGRDVTIKGTDLQDAHAGG